MSIEAGRMARRAEARDERRLALPGATASFYVDGRTGRAAWLSRIQEAAECRNGASQIAAAAVRATRS